VETLEKLRFDGYGIKTLTEIDLNRIFAGAVHDEDFVDEKLMKDLKLTVEHVSGPDNSFMIDLERINLFSGKEIFVTSSIKSRVLVNHLIGFLGAFSNGALESDIDIVLLSDESMENIKNNVPDDDVELIERTYNSNRSINFKFCFISESDFINYYTHRINTSHSKDSAVLPVFERYINSI